MSENDSELNITYKYNKGHVTSATAKVRGHYKTRLRKVIRNFARDVTDKQLNQEIRAINHIMKQRYDRLKNNHLLTTSYAMRAFAEKIEQNIDNLDFKKLAPSKMSRIEKIKYIGSVAGTIDKETMTVAGARRIRDEMLSEFGSSIKRLSAEKKEDFIKSFFVVLSKVGNDSPAFYKMTSDAVKETNDIIDEMRQNGDQFTDETLEDIAKFKAYLRNEIEEADDQITKNLNMNFKLK